MTNVVDLDKARAARREAKGEGPRVRFGGQEYELAAEMPYEVLEAYRGFVGEAAASAAADVAKALLGEHYDAFRATNPSVDDLNELVEGVTTAYGVESPLD